jgi:hypothetical protein
MKTKTMIYLTLLFGLLLACSQDNNDPSETFNSDFESLKGGWYWTSTYDAKKGIIENEYESSIHFISVNADSSINYETFKEGSIEKSGKLTISTSSFGKRIEPCILTNFTVKDEIYFELIANDTVKFYEDCNDCSFYYFTKQ